MPVQDVTSGFRAFSRESLLKLNVVGDYTYTLDSLIQAARKRLAVSEVEIPRCGGSSGVADDALSAATSARRERRRSGRRFTPPRYPSSVAPRSSRW